MISTTFKIINIYLYSLFQGYLSIMYYNQFPPFTIISKFIFFYGEKCKNRITSK